MLTILGGIAIATGIYFWMIPSNDQLINGCEQKTVSRVDCDNRNPDACVYTFEDDSLDAREAGHKKGDILEVCRGDKSPK